MSVCSSGRVTTALDVLLVVVAFSAPVASGPLDVAVEYTGIEASKWTSVGSVRPHVDALRSNEGDGHGVLLHVDTRHDRLCAIYFLNRAYGTPCAATAEGEARARGVAREWGLRLAPEYTRAPGFDTATPVPSPDDCIAYLFTWRLAVTEDFLATD
jgi:hypothetical protein